VNTFNLIAAFNCFGNKHSAGEKYRLCPSISDIFMHNYTKT
jgi:hypothetical protein